MKVHFAIYLAQVSVAGRLFRWLDAVFHSFKLITTFLRPSVDGGEELSAGRNSENKPCKLASL